jgi:hypothetical protein
LSEATGISPTTIMINARLLDKMLGEKESFAIVKPVSLKERKLKKRFYRLRSKISRQKENPKEQLSTSILEKRLIETIEELSKIQSKPNTAREMKFNRGRSLREKSQ